MTWLRGGLYAEGKTDYRFLRPLLDQLLPEIASEILPELPIIDFTEAIDATPPPDSRAERIVEAIASYYEICNLFVVHSDGEGDPSAVRRDRVDPGFTLARERWPNLALVACIPVREFEAWMLADPNVFVTHLEHKVPPKLPPQPEGVLDPKKALTEIVTAPF